VEELHLDSFTNSAPTVASGQRQGGAFDRAGTLIGPYKILCTLGRGGMGVVCRAEQQYPVKRQVALKIIKPGMDSEQAVARFEAERQALALMDHPCIARALDAGMTEGGRLYFVMELVEGVAITQYCQSAGLNVPERLDLFIKICQGIQHAHQRGLIHRDIKPSNILVAEYDGHPVPKVIDFGIAKAIDRAAQASSSEAALTQVGTVIGTFEYMSPEQAASGAAAVDTRSDIYSLGVLLYELLTGATPLDRASLSGIPEHEVLRRIREEDPQRPSQRTGDRRLARILSGDLDWIAIKALEKDPNRRYSTVNALLEDIQHYLDGEPVEACPPSTTYRLGKFTRRHRAPLAAGAAFILLAAAAAGFSAVEAYRARRAEAEATAINNFLQDDVLAQASVRRQAHHGVTPDPELKVRTALDRAAARLAAKFSAQPTIEASLRATIGNAYLDLGLDVPAQQQLERAIALYRRAGGESRPAAAAMGSLEHVYARLGKFPQAAAVARDVWNAERRLRGPNGRDAVIAESRLAVDTAYQRQPDEARRFGQEAVATARRVFGGSDPATATVLGNAGLVEFALENWLAAEKWYAEALEIRRARLGPDDPDTLDSMTDLSTVYHRQQRFADAARLEREILAVRRRVLGPDHPDTLQSMANLSVVLNRQNQFAEAESLDTALLAARRRILGPDHPTTLQNMANLANNYRRLGRLADAERLDSEVLESRKRVLGPADPQTLQSMGDLAADYRFQGKLSQAEPLNRALVDLALRTFGPDASNTRAAWNEMARLCRAQRNYAEAARYSALSLDSSIRVEGPQHANSHRARSKLAFDDARQGKYAEAEPLARRAFEGLRQSAGPASLYTLAAAEVLGEVWHGLGRDGKAEALLRESLALYARAALGSWDEAWCKSLLGASLAGESKFSEGIQFLTEGYRGMLRLAPTVDSSQRINIGAAAVWMADSYAASGRETEAAIWRHKAEDR
jgi:eukaryotic-like serine/threonine-protein kinase